MAIIRGTARGDALRGTPNADTIFGLGGDDDVLARAGDDTVDGGAGNDGLAGELGNDRLFGDDGRDALTGGQGNDRLFGGAGNDTLSDLANGPDGNDVYDGGAGRDFVDFGNQSVGVNLTLAEGAADSRAVQGGEVDVLRSVEGVRGSLGNDVIYGNSANNLLDGGGGNDRLYGRGGNDELGGVNSTTLLLDGGSGNDTLNGGFGVARLFGGTGADTLFASLENAGRPRDVDRNDLGVDSARDLFSAQVNLFEGGVSGFSVERVAHVRGEDRLDINFTNFDAAGASVDAADFLDSDGNGVVNAADRDARLVGGNLVLDLDQLFEREGDLTVDLGEQHVILERIASVDADQFI